MIGDANDIYRRLIAQLPPWFGTDHPVLDSLLAGYVSPTVFHYNQIQYVFQQTRIKTATGNNLDLVSQDFFGDALPRRATSNGYPESDDSFRARILANILQERATRFGIYNALLLLTGIPPILFEPWRPLDTGGYNVASTMGYSTHGLYGSGSYPYQGFIDVFLPPFQGLAYYPGYNLPTSAGYNLQDGIASLWYGGDSLVFRIITPEDVYQTVQMTKVWGTICWVAIHQIKPT